MTPQHPAAPEGELTAADVDPTFARELSNALVEAMCKSDVAWDESRAREVRSHMRTALAAVGVAGAPAAPEGEHATGAIVPERQRCICGGICLEHCRACNYSGRDLEEPCIADPDWEADDDDLARREQNLPAALEGETDASVRLTAEEWEAITEASWNGGSKAWRAAVERIVAERLRVVEGERDAWKSRRDAAVEQCRHLHQDGKTREQWHLDNCGAMRALRAAGVTESNPFDTLADRIRDEAAQSSRSGQMERLEGIAREVERLRQGAKTLGHIIESNGRAILDITGRHDLIGDDGDGDWGAVWDHLYELPAKAWDEGMRCGTSRAMRQMSDEPNLPLASAADNPYRATEAKR